MTKQNKKRTRRRLTRREFLIAAGITGAGLVVGVRLGIPPARLKIAEYLESSGGPPSSFEVSPTAWFEITPENRVKMYLPKMEMGQGIHTALGQILAEELEVDWSQVEVNFASTDRGIVDPVATSASNSVSSMYDILRETGATMREILRNEAGRQLNLSPDTLMIENALIFSKDSPEISLTYGQVVAQKTADGSEWEIPKEIPPLKSPGDFRHIGQSIPRVDLWDKILGKAVYGYDARVPGMLYGAVARPPTISGSLKNASVGEADTKPGVVKVVTEADFAGVVAESRAQAYTGLNAMDIEWDLGSNWQQADIENMVRVGEGTRVVIQNDGNIQDYLEQDVIQAQYQTPMAFHAHLEPVSALADVQSDQVRIWTSTQGPAGVRSAVAKALNRKEEEIIVIPTYLGGGFGRKIDNNPAIEAARLSQAAGRPVHVGWTRPEDFRDGYLRPPTHHVLRAHLDSGGRIQMMEHQQSSGDVAFAFMPSFVASIMGADFGAWRGALIQYGIPNKQTVAWRVQLPVRTGWWRGLGLMANNFAIESFMDELAYTSGQDPLAFREAHLPEGELGQRLQRVLKTGAFQANWGNPSASDRAQGLAVSVDVNTIVVHIAEVSVLDRQIRVHKVTSVVDPGLVINPDGAIAQTQGAIMMGLSSTLIEEATIKDGKIASGNFDTYPLLTIKDTPDIEVTLLKSGDRPYGLGEPPIGPVAAAVANAVFALTGQRLRKLPLKLV